MDFNPDTWGTIADWVGGLGTTAAFIATFIVLLRDAKQRRRLQAQKVAFYVDEQVLSDLRGGTATYNIYTVSNLSDEPIYDVRIMAEPRGEYRDNVRRSRHLQPGDKLVYSVKGSPGALSTPASFRDNSGRRWHRDAGGGLRELGLVKNRLLSRIRR